MITILTENFKKQETKNNELIDKNKNLKRRINEMNRNMILQQNLHDQLLTNFTNLYNRNLNDKQSAIK